MGIRKQPFFSQFGRLLALFLILVIAVPLLLAQEVQIERALFQKLEQRFEQARQQEVPLYAPQSYSDARENFNAAKEAFRKGAKLSRIREQVRQANLRLEAAFRIAEKTRPVLHDLVESRQKIAALNYNRVAPEEMAKAERYFRSALQKAEEGDIAGAKAVAENVNQQYRLATVKWLQETVVKKSERDLQRLAKGLSPRQREKSQNDLRSVRNILELDKKRPFDVFEYRKEMLDKIKGVLQPLYPPFYRDLPDTLLIGEFTLILGSYSDRGYWDFSRKQAVGLSGVAWSSFHCPLMLFPFFPPQIYKVEKMFQVVKVVTKPDLQISLDEARLLSPQIVLGDTVALPLAVKQKTFQDIVAAKADLIGKLKELKKGDFKVKFENVTIQPVPGRENVGRIVQGTAVYPTSPPNPEEIKLSLLGFRVLMDSLVISTSQAVGNMTLEFPSTLASGKNCQPTRLYLGAVKISQQCEFYVEKLSDAYGPFWIGNTGVQVYGTGFVADFSSTQSYAGASPPFVASWKGVYLKTGQSIPAPTGTVYSNTGYAKGKYSYHYATVTASGFKGALKLTGGYSFFPTQPFGYQVTLNHGQMQIDKNRISGGELRSAIISLPEQAVSDAGFNKIVVVSDTLHIRQDGDLFGKVKYQEPVVWGEYTRLSPKLMAYSAQVESDAYFYLSASYREPFWPFKSGGFYSPSFYPLEQTLDSLAIQGVTFFGFQRFYIYTPDTPGATPIEFGPGELQRNSWLNVVSQGVHGRFGVVEFPRDSIELGPTSSPHYVGKKPFTTRLIARKRFFNVQFANSAVYNCRMDGAVHLKGPSQILLNFKKMAFTSTAHNAGGEVDLSTPDTLDYWGVIAVQKPGFSSAGLICVKTGQVILTAAGLYEPRHFAQPFYLTWGEMLADGNLGRLFFDYNTANQKFDGFDFAPSAVKLSEYKPGKPGYLQAGGTAHFDFFGANYLNIHDFKYNKTVAPFNGRRIKLGFDKGKKFLATDTTIQRNWSGDFGNFNFNIAYDSTDQDGFVGKGLIGLNMVSDGGMDGTIVLSSSRICMSIWETDRHDFTLGPVAHFGSMASIWGCACIESGQLKRLMLGAELETTGNANVLLRSAAYGKIEYLITPSVSEMTINGNMYVSIISGGNLEVTGRARFKVDRALAYVDGDLYGKFDSSNLMGGLSAEGQVNWHLGTVGSEGYISLQGKVAVTCVSLIGPSVSTEGGFYVGINAPKNKAWILQDEHSRFRLNTSALPDHLTGLYGYNQSSVGFNVFIFSGGIETYVGLGAFVLTAAQANALQVVASGFGGLPFAIGHLGVHIHGEILGGLVSAGAWGDLQMIGPYPFSFQGTVGLEGCVVWVVCGSVDVTVGLNSSQGFYID